MYYLVTVNYSSDTLDKQGNSKVVKTKYVIEADSIEEVVYVMANFHKGDTMYDSIDSIRKLPLGDVITRSFSPEFYKPQ